MKTQLIEMIATLGFEVEFKGIWTGEAQPQEDTVVNGMVFEEEDLDGATEQEIINLLLGIISKINVEGVEVIEQLVKVGSKHNDGAAIYPVTNWKKNVPAIDIKTPDYKDVEFRHSNGTVTPAEVAAILKLK